MEAILSKILKYALCIIVTTCTIELTQCMCCSHKFNKREGWQDLTIDRKQTVIIDEAAHTDSHFCDKLLKKWKCKRKNSRIEPFPEEQPEVPYDCPQQDDTFIYLQPIPQLEPMPRQRIGCCRSDICQRFTDWKRENGFRFSDMLERLGGLRMLGFPIGVAF